MSTINLSNELINIYEDNGISIEYAISELLPYLSKKHTTTVNNISMTIKEPTKDVEISCELFQKCSSIFSNIKEINTAIEIILWNNYFLGMTL